MASGHPHLPPHPHPHPHVHHDNTSNPNPVGPSPIPASNNNNNPSGANNSSSSASVSQPSSNPTAAINSNHNNSVGNNSNSVSNVNIPAPITAAQIPQHARLMCSYGGRILPRPGDHQLRYVGGETRIVAFPRTASFATLVSLLSSLAPSQFSPKSPPVVKYQLPNEDLDSLISLCSDDDLVNMLDELDRLNSGNKSLRIRLFLFPSSSTAASQGGGGVFGSVLSTGESNQWFLDALNSASPTAVGQALERRRSEASSSMLSDQPDYLTGIDTGSERSPVNVDTDPTETIEPPEPAVAPLPQEAPVQPAPAPPVYYMPQPMPVYYVSAPVQYMQPSLEGQGSLPIRGYVPMPMPMPRPVYYSKENEQFVGISPGSFVYEQAPAGTTYVRAPLSYPPAAMYPPPQTDAGMKPPAVPGSDVRGLQS